MVEFWEKKYLKNYQTKDISPKSKNVMNQWNPNLGVLGSPLLCHNFPRENTYMWYMTSQLYS